MKTAKYVQKLKEFYWMLSDIRIPRVSVLLIFAAAAAAAAAAAGFPNKKRGCAS